MLRTNPFLIGSANVKAFLFPPNLFFLLKINFFQNPIIQQIKNWLALKADGKDKIVLQFYPNVFRRIFLKKSKEIIRKPLPQKADAKIRIVAYLMKCFQ